MADSASTLKLTFSESMRELGCFVEPHAKRAATNLLVAFYNMKADEAKDIVNDTTKVIKHSGLFVIAASDALYS